MIDEAVGKVLGMAMAYVASAMGMFVAYVNYRKRIVKADRVMTSTAWAVIALTLLATLGGTLVVAQLTAGRPAAAAPAIAEPTTADVQEERVPPAAREEAEPARAGWSWIGIIVPAAIFLFATVVTAALHRHFSTQGH